MKVEFKTIVENVCCIADKYSHIMIVPSIVIKVYLTKAGKKYGNVASITHEIAYRTPNKEGNPYHTREHCYITVTKTAISNQEWTNLMLKKVILSCMGMEKDGRDISRENRPAVGVGRV